MTEWLTTAPNPARPAYGPDSGQRGWRLHYVNAGSATKKHPVTGETIDVTRSLCGLVPQHGWGLDMFIEEPCKRCQKALKSSFSETGNGN